MWAEFKFPANSVFYQNCRFNVTPFRSLCFCAIFLEHPCIHIKDRLIYMPKFTKKIFHAFYLVRTPMNFLKKVSIRLFSWQFSFSPSPSFKYGLSGPLLQNPSFFFSFWKKTSTHTRDKSHTAISSKRGGQMIGSLLRGHLRRYGERERERERRERERERSPNQPLMGTLFENFT